MAQLMLPTAPMNSKTFKIGQGQTRTSSDNEKPVLKLSRKDKRTLGIIFGFACAGTLLYLTLGGRNLFVFPALLCIAFGIRKFRR